jgi:hypothetical protein
MPARTMLQIVSQSDVKTFGHLNALQDVNARKAHGWLAEP